MKFAQKLVIFSLVIFSFSAFACPDLTGMYLCSDSDNSFTQKIKQEILSNGITVYSIDDLSFTTDKKLSTYSNDTNGFVTKGEVLGECMGDGIISFSNKFDLSLEGHVLMSSATNTRILKSLDGTFRQTIIGYLESPEHKLEINKDYTCKPQ